MKAQRSMVVRGAVGAALCFAWLTANAAPPSYEGKVVLFGNLHAHAKLSDDIKNPPADFMPINAFQYADAHGIDFLAISEHHKALDAPGNPLRLTQAEYKSQLYDVAMSYNTQHANAFIAIPAIEWGNTATGNHVNVFGMTTLPPDTIADADYNELLEWAVSNAKFVQFNHPYSWETEKKRNKRVGNFGEALYPSTQAFVQATDPAVSTVSVISTVAGGHLGGKWAESDQKSHRERNEKGWGHYLRFLNLGFHISPAANQDTHGKNWGTVTAARTAVWADAFTYDSLMDAIRKNKVYATEDDELTVSFRVLKGDKAHWMGDTVPLASDEEDVTVEVVAWQGEGSDNDDTDEGPYTITFFMDMDGVGGQEAAIVGKQKGVLAKQPFRKKFQVSDGQYILVGVTEENGKDNELGDGEDEVHNETGDDGKDGKRDDLNDGAWTSPIWFARGEAVAAPAFVWSKRSELYHDASCWAVKQIGQANRVESNSPPTGKRKHVCSAEQ